MSMKWYGVELKDKVVREMYRRTNRAVMLIEKVAKHSMKKGGRTVSGYKEWSMSLSAKGNIRFKKKAARIGAFRSLPGEPPRTQTGTLRRSITHEVFPKADEVISSFSTPDFVGRVGTNVKYGKYLEFGTRPRTIKGKFGARPSSVKKGSWGDFGYTFNNPGIKPRPWLRPAFHHSQRAIAAIFRRPIKQL